MKWGAVLTLGVVLTSSALAQRPGRGGGSVDAQFLRRVEMAQLSIKYYGVRKTLIRLEGSATENVEKIWKDGRRLRIEFEKGSDNFGEIVVVDGRRRWHYFPSSNEIQIRPAEPDTTLRRLTEAVGGRGAGFTLNRDGTATVANRSAFQVSIRDRSGNTVAKLWVDRENSTLLKRESFDPSGRLVGSFEFTSINFRPEFQPGDFEIQRKGAKIVSMADLLASAARKAGLPATRLPDSSGYELDSVRSSNLAGNTVLIQGYVSEEGRVTLFISRKAINPERMSRLGAGRVSSQVWSDDGVHFALVGPTTETELRRLVALIRAT